MSDLQQLEARLSELHSERDGLLAARTKEATAEAARTFLDGARARSQGVGGVVVGGHATGQSLDDVLRAFLHSDAKLEGWLVEQAEQFAELTAKQRDSRLRKFGTESAKAETELREARKAAAIAAIEAEFAPAGDAA
jgi:nucleotide-binding universal stress UspA family protein